MIDQQLPIVDGATRLYGIIGHPIVQVKSPAIITERLRRMGVNALVLPFHIKPEDFDATMRGLMMLANLDGLIVTLPYKNAVKKHLDRILPAAERIGAVNAIRRDRHGVWWGDMFDGKGCVNGMRASGVDPKGLSIMLLGAGGAGSAIADGVAEAGAASLTIFDLDAAKAAAVAAQVSRQHPNCVTTAGQVSTDTIDVLINATPVGMAPGDGLPAEIRALNQRLFVVDIITEPQVTPLLAFARQSGCRTMGGNMMVAGQAEAIIRFLRAEA